MVRKPTQQLIGRRIRLMKTRTNEITPGSTGTVDSFDENSVVFIKWDDGRKTGLAWHEGDRWAIINE